MPQPKEYRSNADRQSAYRRRRNEAYAALQTAKGLMALPSIAAIPGWRRWRQVLEQAEQAVRDIHDQMQSYYDERSDDWLESEKADAFTEKMEAVEELIDQVADCRGRIE